MKNLLHLQDLDLKIEACKTREDEIPKQKSKFDLQRKRLALEIEERKARCQELELEQRSVQGEIDQKLAQITKYEAQLYSIRKNEEYQALLHEIDSLKKQVALAEEKMISCMVGLDDARDRLKEDQQRIEREIREIERHCIEIDEELKAAVRDRQELEAQRTPLVVGVERDLLSKYDRIRNRTKSGPAVVPLRNESCAGCNMSVRPQMVNSVMAGEVESCPYCGRLLYFKENFAHEAAGAPPRMR